MEIDDIIRNKVRYNLDKKSRKRYYIYNRMYLYAILFHIHNWSLENIGEMFKTDHATVLNALKKAHYTQHYKEFNEYVGHLQEQYFFIIPPYKNERGRTKPNSKRVYEVCIGVSKEQYINYLKSKDPELIYEAMWKMTLDKLNTRIGKMTIPTQE